MAAPCILVELEAERLVLRSAPTRISITASSTAKSANCWLAVEEMFHCSNS